MTLTCDRKECAAQALITVHVADQEVLLCGHHFNDNRDKLYADQDVGKLTLEFTPEAAWLSRPEPELVAA